MILSIPQLSHHWSVTEAVPSDFNISMTWSFSLLMLTLLLEILLLLEVPEVVLEEIGASSSVGATLLPSMEFVLQPISTVAKVATISEESKEHPSPLHRRLAIARRPSKAAIRFSRSASNANNCRFSSRALSRSWKSNIKLRVKSEHSYTFSDL